MNRSIRSRRVQSLIRKTLLAAAATAAPALAVDRSWLVANGVWGTPNNWNPLGTPTLADNAFIGNTAGATNGTVSLGANASAGNLAINDGMTLRTQLFTPTIGGHTSVSGFNDPAGPDFFASTLWVDDGNNAIDFQSNSLSVEDGARLRLSNGGVVRIDGLFDIAPTSDVVGQGVINLHRNGASPAMTLNGQIQSNSSGSLTITQNGTALIDLDGTQEGDQIISVTGTTGASFARININGTSLFDAFGDEIRVGRGNVMNMNVSSGWTLSSAGLVRFVHDPARTAAGTFSGGAVTVNGDIAVDADGHGEWNSDAAFQPSATVTVAQGGTLAFNGATVINGGVFNVSNFGNLDFQGPTTISAGTFTAGGPVGDISLAGPTTWTGGAHFSGITRQMGNATVSAATIIHGGTFDMDGVSGLTQWTVNAPLTMNATEIEFSGAGMEGEITVNSPNFFSQSYADINVDTPGGWIMGGTLNLNGSTITTASTTLRGSDMRLQGVANISGPNATSARIGIEAGSVVNIGSGSWRFDGGTIANPNKINGGLIQGLGAIRASSNHALVGSGTISNVAIEFGGNSELRAAGGTLRIDAPINDVGVIGTADDAGLLSIINPWNTNVADRLELLGGRVSGAAITNDGAIVGRGLVTPVSIVNNGSISASGGELFVNTISSSTDLDGTAATGRLNAVSGNLTIEDQPTDAFDGRAFVGFGRTLRLNQGWIVNTAGSVELGGAPGLPATLAGGAQEFRGTAVISGPTRFDLDTNFTVTSHVISSAVGDSLTLEQNASIVAGATFSGPGELRVGNASTTTLLANASVGMGLVNSGTLHVDSGLSTTIVSTQRFQQEVSGALQVQLAGATPGLTYDRLSIATDAQLSGRLSLSLLNGYDPSYLVAHEVLRADSRTGVFGTIGGNQIAPNKWLAVTYDADSVLVSAALPGDANLDGAVNLDDFTAMAAGFGVAGTWSTGNFNGDGKVNLDDFTALAANFGISLPADLPRGTAVPEPTLAALALGLTPLLGRRQRWSTGR